MKEALEFVLSSWWNFGGTVILLWLGLGVPAAILRDRSLMVTIERRRRCEECGADDVRGTKAV